MSSWTLRNSEESRLNSLNIDELQIPFAFQRDRDTRACAYVYMCICAGACYIELTISRLFGEQTWGPATCLGTHFELWLRTRASLRLYLAALARHMSARLYSKGSNKAQDVVATYNQSNARTISIKISNRQITDRTWLHHAVIIIANSLANPKSIFPLAGARRYLSSIFQIETFAYIQVSRIRIERFIHAQVVFARDTERERESSH